MYINRKYKFAHRYLTDDGTIEYCLNNKKDNHNAISKDWFIIYCFTSSEKYFSIIQDEKKFNDI